MRQKLHYNVTINLIELHNVLIKLKSLLMILLIKILYLKYQFEKYLIVNDSKYWIFPKIKHNLIDFKQN